MAGDFFRVTPDRGPSGLAPLAARDPKAAIALAPGKWRAQVLSVGLAEEVVSFGADTVRIAIASGAPIKADAKMVHKAEGDEVGVIASRLPRPTVDFELPAGATTRLSTALVFDRGTPPEMLDEFKRQLLAKLPDGSVPVMVASALGGAFADLGIALAVAGFTLAADAIIESMFGRAVILRGAVPVTAQADGRTQARLCLTALPDPRAINVGRVPGPDDYLVGPQGRLFETRRGQAFGVEDSPDHPGHVPSVETHLVVELTRR